MGELREPWWTDDDALLDVVAVVLRPPQDPLDAVRAAGRAAFTWRDVSGEVDRLLAPARPSAPTPPPD